MKRMMGLLLTLVLISVLAVGCSNSSKRQPGSTQAENDVEAAAEVKQEEKIHIKVAAPSGAPTLSMIKMFKENPSLGKNVEVSYESVKSPDLMASRLMSSEVDIAVVPTNLAANIYNKGIPYQLAASNVWGVLYLVSSEDINDWHDLKGKEIHTIGRGLTPDIVLRYLLSNNGIDPEKDVTLNYLGEATELASAFIAGKSKISVIPEPVLSNVLMKKEGTKIVLNLQEEWAKTTNMDSSYPQASLIIKKDIIEKYPELVEAFVKEFEDSINWANDYPTEAGIYSEELQTGLNPQVVEKGMERSNIKFVNVTEAKSAIETYLKILHDYSPDIVGGKLPDDDFYFKK
ncbi:ABC-type nitrate/sulfonate/bicarbonate transport system, periplasmic component [Clostridium aceticum]|uniref:ABC-type nitrate/sulfonate/bicarbonate transport system, periplasmic component n=1 Tax=Clostridium aceticum TaxID=84022 RepID=A0A0D8IAB2_9CLOT|nr:ABC transporter substrate-binding protein [Clostridium aceticum]AKL96385.1 ABC-type nitrate/sulfonate/bicarbonate transport system, periplasmic component [Clostridium aceticum]KJF26962.1 taurine ABC transporter substrate-binding protein [Clostridium aceticum]